MQCKSTILKTMANEENKTQENAKYTVLSPKLGGGPHGVGDPNDLTMRKVEKDILVAKIVRDRARDEKCVPEVAAFNECCKESKYLMVFTCRKENTELKECLTKWYKDEPFWEECKQIYLKDRSDFRRTGEPKKIRDFKARYANSF